MENLKIKMKIKIIRKMIIDFNLGLEQTIFYFFLQLMSS